MSGQAFRLGVTEYRVRGIGVAVCRGRKREQQKIIGQSNDNHVLLWGRGISAKTVLLRAIAEFLSNGTGPINGTLYWDLRERAILNDADFFNQFRARLAMPVGAALSTVFR